MKELSQETKDGQTHRADLAIKRADLSVRKAEAQERLSLADERASTIRLNDTELKLKKINALSELLEALTIDPDKTMIGSDPFLKPVFDESEVLRIKGRLFKLIDEL